VDNAPLTMFLSSLVTISVAGFAVWKSYYEARKTDGKVSYVQMDIVRCQDEFNRTVLLLQQTQEKLRSAEQEREEMRKELYRAQQLLNLLEGQIRNQESRIQELRLLTLTLTHASKE